jgi:hypothetical protein
MPPHVRRRWHLLVNPTRRQRKIWVTLALVAALTLGTFVGSQLWSYRHHASTPAQSNAVAAALPSSKSLQATAIGTPGTGVTGDAPTAPTDRDPFASSQQLVIRNARCLSVDGCAATPINLSVQARLGINRSTALGFSGPS